MIWTNEPYELDDGRHRLDMDQLSSWIRNQYWALDRTHRQVLESWRNAAIVFGLYKDGAPAGCARVVSDLVAIAYLADVFVAPEHRGAGIGTWMIRTIVDHPDLRTVGWLLHTRDAHDLYRRIGFVEVGPRIMERSRTEQ